MVVFVDIMGSQIVSSDPSICFSSLSFLFLRLTQSFNSTQSSTQTSTNESTPSSTPSSTPFSTPAAPPQSPISGRVEGEPTFPPPPPISPPITSRLSDSDFHPANQEEGVLFDVLRELDRERGKRAQLEEDLKKTKLLLNNALDNTTVDNKVDNTGNSKEEIHKEQKEVKEGHGEEEEEVRLVGG